METLLAFTRELHNSVDKETLDRLVNAYLDLYEQLKDYEGKENIHSLIMDLLHEEIQVRRDEELQGRLGV